MRKIRDGFRMVCLFIRLVYEMMKNYFSLNEDMEHNFMICKKICQKIVRASGVRLCIHHPEHIKTEEPFLLVSNHRCFFDVVFLIACVDSPVSFVAAKELLSYPILRKYLASLQCVMLDRYTKELIQIRESVMNMKNALANRSLVVFPEGECSYHDWHMKKFKKGCFVGVSEMDTFVVPVYISIGKIRNIGRWMIPQGEVSLWFGEGFHPKDVLKKKNSASELASFVQRKITDLQGIATGDDKLS